MAWKMVDNAILTLFNRNLDLTNSTADTFKIVLAYGATSSNALVTVADFLSNSSGESNNYTRPSLANVAITPGTGGMAQWQASNVNITPTGVCHTNIAAIYENAADVDANSNIVVLGEFGFATFQINANTTVEFALDGGIFNGDDAGFP